MYKYPLPVICDACDEPIEENDDYVSAGGSDFHLYCLELMSTRELIETLGSEIKTMEDEHGECG